MKTKTLVLRHWEDVVFQNRNQSYGAYMLRRAYAKRVILGWGITVALFATLLYLSDLTLPNAADIIPPFVDGTERTVIVYPPPSLEQRPRQQVQQTATASTSRQITITTEPVDAPVEPIETFTSAPDDTGIGGAIDGFVDGTAAPIEEPVVVKPEPIRDFAEIMPEYNGGLEAMMRYIQGKIRYPASARRIGITGTVFVRFVVGADGQISNVEVIRGISKDCDAEAARVIASMPKWTAAIQNGVNVPVRMVLPIKFALQQ